MFIVNGTIIIVVIGFKYWLLRGNYSSLMLSVGEVCIGGAIIANFSVHEVSVSHVNC